MSTTPHSTAAKSSKVVMLVEDSAHFRGLVSIALQRAGHEVVEACDGQQAWDMLTSGKVAPHIIVSDVNMPKMDGLEFARMVKASPAHKFTPILMLTTESQAAKKAEGKAAGVKAWMVKPFQPSQLVEAIEKLCP
jgi:two-component system, chemotaxis family, chemotaxis protein CheY